MEKKLLLREGDYVIWRHSGIPHEASNFIYNIAWGQDGPVYKHRDTLERLRLLTRPTLISINKDEKIIGTAVFCNTPVWAGTNRYNCYYIRYFAASEEIKGKGLMKKYAQKVMEAIRDNEQEKTVFFAFVEKDNQASYQIVQNAGYDKIGVLKTHGFSRFFPKAKKEIEQVKTEPARKEVQKLLQEQFSRHALVQFNSIFLNDNYYVIRENGKIVAGCQYHRVHWVVNNMPGLTGKIIMHMVPVIPMINKLFHPKRFEFLAFEGIYVRPGSEVRLLELFEALLVKEKLHSAMYWMGENCPVRKRITEKGKTGLLHSFIKGSDAYIMASFCHMNEEEITDLKSRPLFASAFDFI